VRWELRPRLFLRGTEFLWQKATPHTPTKRADREIMVAADFYEEIAQDYAAIPVLVGDKTPSERFPGAVRTVTLEAMMRDGRALQAGRRTTRYNFARPSTSPTPEQTASGRSAHGFVGDEHAHDRRVIMAHGDDRA